MIALIIIVVILLITFVLPSKKTQIPEAKKNIIKQNSDREQKEELIKNIQKNIKIEVITSNSNNSDKDESIIDVTGNVYNLRNEQSNLLKHTEGVPVWKHQYVYSPSEINSATKEQIKFYNYFKYRFLKGEYFDLEGNTNYAFILLFDLIGDYENHKNLLEVERQLEELGQYYPKTKSYALSSLIKKLEQIGDSEAIAQLRNQQSSSFRYQQTSSNTGYSFDGNYWGLGTQFQKSLILTNEEVELLNTISYYSNNFFEIKYCSTEIIKLFLAFIKELNLLYSTEGTNVQSIVLFIADIIVTKQLKYKANTESYKYTIETYKRVIYTALFKICENAVREKYFHKRKLNTDLEYLNQEYKNDYENKIISKVLQALPKLTSSISLPDEETEIELNSQNTTRWKFKFEELVNSYTHNSEQFVDSIISLGELNKKNPSVENIFFEASKFLSKHNKEAALTLYVYYLYHDLKSVTIDNKPLTKTIQKNLFKTNDQLHDFQIVVSELVKNKNLEKALQGVLKIYEVKRKKIVLDGPSINKEQKKHSETVVLLTNILDDYEDESNIIRAEQVNNDEVKIEITQKTETGKSSAYASAITFTQIQTETLEIFAKYNFLVPQSDLDVFAKLKGVFKNQLIESINEICYENLDDVLIEEEDDQYTINQNYYQRLLAK